MTENIETQRSSEKSNSASQTSFEALRLLAYAHELGKAGPVNEGDKDTLTYEDLPDLTLYAPERSIGPIFSKQGLEEIKPAVSEIELINALIDTMDHNGKSAMYSEEERYSQVNELMEPFKHDSVYAKRIMDAFFQEMKFRNLPMAEDKLSYEFDSDSSNAVLIYRCDQFTRIMNFEDKDPKRLAERQLEALQLSTIELELIDKFLNTASSTSLSLAQKTGHLTNLLSDYKVDPEYFSRIVTAMAQAIKVRGLEGFVSYGYMHGPKTGHFSYDSMSNAERITFTLGYENEDRR